MKRIQSPVGLRTVKTAAAVAAAVVLVEQYGTSADKIIFGVMGAFSAMEPTIRASVRGCIAQFSGVAVGVILSLLTRILGISGPIAAGVGVVLIISSYQLFRWRSSPVLPCLILATICTSPELGAVAYGLERLWNTMLGLAAGMTINTLIFPYDNSKKISRMLDTLDGDLVRFLEDLFDGDDHLPGTEDMEKKLDQLEGQLALFADQRLFRRGRQRRLLFALRTCEETARALLIEVETLRGIDHIGKLNRENRAALIALGAKISEEEENCRFQVEDLVVNYHVSRALELREELIRELSENK